MVEDETVTISPLMFMGQSLMRRAISCVTGYLESPSERLLLTSPNAVTSLPATTVICAGIKLPLLFDLLSQI